MTIHIPFTPAAGTDAKDYSILYVADNGTIELMNAVYENGCLVMKTNHFSEYVIVYNAAGSDVLEGNLVLLACAAAIIVAVFIKKREYQ